MSKFLNDFSAFIKERNINVYTIAVAEGDGEAELVRFKECNPCQNSYSVSKFFTLTAIGLLCDEGVLSLDERITDILSAYCPKGMDEKWRSITVEMAIRHYCGLPEGYLDIDCGDVAEFGNDYLSYVLSTPVGDTNQYSYTDAEFYLLSRVVREKAHCPLTAYLWKKLFYPLGFGEVAWSTCPQNHAMGATGLYIRTEDMVKLGTLYLNKGIYGEKRILSEKWVDTVLEKGYLHGYYAGGYGHGGMRGQMLLVLPKQKRAVAWHGYHAESEAINAFLADYLERETKEK